MRVNLNIQMPGDDKRPRPRVKRPLTQKMYLDWVDKLHVSDDIKDRFRALVRKVPSTTYPNIIAKRHEYIKRFHEEIRRELLGGQPPQTTIVPPMGTEEVKQPEPSGEDEPQRRIVVSWDDEDSVLSNEKKEQDGSQSSTQEEDPWTKAGKENEPTPENDADSDSDADQGGPATDWLKRTADNLRASVPDGTGGVLRPSCQLPAGCERPEEGSPAAEGDSDDRLRILNGDSTGVQGVHLGQEWPCEGGSGDPKCTGADWFWFS